MRLCPKSARAPSQRAIILVHLRAILRRNRSWCPQRGVIGCREFTPEAEFEILQPGDDGFLQLVEPLRIAGTGLALELTQLGNRPVEIVGVDPELGHLPSQRLGLFATRGSLAAQLARFTSGAPARRRIAAGDPVGRATRHCRILARTPILWRPPAISALTVAVLPLTTPLSLALLTLTLLAPALALPLSLALTLSGLLSLALTGLLALALPLTGLLTLSWLLALPLTWLLSLPLSTLLSLALAWLLALTLAALLALTLTGLLAFTGLRRSLAIRLATPIAQ